MGLLVAKQDSCGRKNMHGMACTTVFDTSTATAHGVHRQLCAALVWPWMVSIGTTVSRSKGVGAAVTMVRNHLAMSCVFWFSFLFLGFAAHDELAWHGMVDACDGCLAAEASGSSFG